MNEFELIERYFSTQGQRRGDVVLGIGDDCALLRMPPGMELAVSMDTLVEGVHFSLGTAPEALGHKALAVNLSDLAAMGAEPAWTMLALTLPREDLPWLEAFSRGFVGLADRFGVQLVGGDTTRGPLSITVQVNGLLPAGTALRRAGAQVGDGVYVTGTLGDAGLALLQLQQQGVRDPAVINRLERPEPRVKVGMALRGLASATIDISDGLLADLRHILRASRCGALLQLERLPLSPSVSALVSQNDDWLLPLASGDDYELCFTASPSSHDEIEHISRELGLPITRIGEVRKELGLACELRGTAYSTGSVTGFMHFK